MMDKRFIDSYLRINNVDERASEATVRKTLGDARWPKEEIEEAILVRNGDEAAKARLIQKEKERTFRPDMDWSSTKLSTLLGTDVVIDPKLFQTYAHRQEQAGGGVRTILFGLSIAAIATIIAAGIGVALLYFLEMGPFYTQAQDII
ncbi:hypothetical protein HY416_04165 [Candidatus Kaiserbacteria bacterium]|nr:hypothetical protein [Candidatus Kaiserbacteria bacterium]